MKYTNDFLETVKEKLVERKKDLTEMLESSSKDKVSDDQVQDTGDEALSLTMEKLKNSLEKNEIDEIKLINEALERIKNNSFGECIDCHDNISQRRIEHYPYAARCILCQEELEQRDSLS